MSIKLTQRFLIITFLLFSMALAKADWEFFEKTKIKGTVSGTIQKGRVFEMASGSVYQVSEITVQVVVQIMPEVTVLRDGKNFKLIVKGFPNPLICKQLVSPGSATSNANATAELSSPPPAKAFQDVPLEKLIPEDLQKEMGLQKLSREEKKKLHLHILALCSSAYELGTKQAAGPAALKPTSVSASVIESQIEGESNGFSGDTIFELTNGQIWQQVQYYHEYNYSYRPKILIFDDGSGYKIKIEGIDETVKVRRIK